MEKFGKDKERLEESGIEKPLEAESSLADRVLALNEQDKFWEIANRAGFKDAYDDGEYLVIKTFTPDRSQIETVKIYDNKHNLCFEADFAAMKKRAEEHERQKTKGGRTSLN